MNFLALFLQQSDSPSLGTIVIAVLILIGLVVFFLWLISGGNKSDNSITPDSDDSSDDEPEEKGWDDSRWEEPQGKKLDRKDPPPPVYAHAVENKTTRARSRKLVVEDLEDEYVDTEAIEPEVVEMVILRNSDDEDPEDEIFDTEENPAAAESSAEAKFVSNTEISETASERTPPTDQGRAWEVAEKTVELPPSYSESYRESYGTRESSAHESSSSVGESSRETGSSHESSSYDSGSNNDCSSSSSDSGSSGSSSD